jgi:hypothetical protein
MRTLLTIWPERDQSLNDQTRPGKPLAIYLRSIKQITITPCGKPTVLLFPQQAMDALRACWPDQPTQED